MEAKGQGPRAWGCACSDPGSHPDSIHHPAWRVWEKGGGRRGETKWKRERGCFCGCGDNSLCPAASWGYKGHQCQAKTKARATSRLDAHRHTCARSLDFLLGRHGNKKAIVGSCLRWKRMEKQIYKQTMELCVHVCHYTLACVHPHGHAQWRQTDCGWYHYSKHRWQEGQRDSSLIEHIYMAVCVYMCVSVWARERETEREGERQANRFR